MTEMIKSHLIEVIKAANETFIRHFEAAEFKKLAELYTPDGMLLPPNADMIKGREGIEAFWKAVHEMGITAAKLDTMEVEDCGYLGVEVGLFELYGAQHQMLDKGKYVVTWKHEQGEWKLYRDIFNTSLPAK